MGAELAIIEVEFGSMEIVLSSTSRLSRNLINRLLASLNTVSQRLHAIEQAADEAGMSMDELSGKKGWMRNQLKRIDKLVIRALIQLRKAGTKTPKATLVTDYTTETFTLKSEAGMGSVVVREFKSDFETWREHFEVESTGAEFEINSMGPMIN